jgi:hypothetical protein
MRFVYSVVRFVPDPARGEFVNVGAIAGSEESSEWQVRQVENPMRARAVDERKTLEAVWAFLDSIGYQIDEFDRGMETLLDTEVELSEAWLRELCSRHRNIVQLSPPTPILANSADEALDRVFEHMVVDPAQRTYGFRKKHSALAAVRKAYRQHAVKKGVHLRERVPLRTLHHETRFDFAVTNGRALQLAQTWSFQVPDQDSLSEQIKAWGWTMREVRDEGGRVEVASGEELEVSRDVDLEVIYVPPAEGQNSPALDEARSIFSVLGVSSRPLGEAEQVGQRASELLVQAGAKTAPLPGT